MYVKELGLAKTKRRVCCPHPDCGVSQYWEKDSKEFLFYCTSEMCLRASCLVCNKQFKPPKDKNKEHVSDQTSNDALLSKEEEKSKETEDSIDSHILQCGKYAEYTMKITEILRDGNECEKIVDECNHITCDICGTEFCYFCGKSMEECDKKPPGTSMYHHFDT